MRYHITIWKYDGEEVSQRAECYCGTYYEALEIFDILCRGVRGYYRAWFIDTEENKEIQYSSVLRDTIGG